MNAGWAGMFEWIRANDIDWGCSCPSNAANSPYTLDKLPSIDHPNCMCNIQPTIRDDQEFIADLERWADGETVDYLDKWYLDVYQRAG